MEEKHENLSEKSKKLEDRKKHFLLFPRESLQKVLVIPRAIWQQNAGKPFNMIDLAAAVNMSPTSSSFQIRLASCYRYGLTEGSRTTKVVTLTKLGMQVVAPTSDEELNKSLRQALTFNPLFTKVFNHFNDKPLPREEVLKNTLTRSEDTGGFGIPRDHVATFLNVFMKNIKDFDLLQDIKGTEYLRLRKLGSLFSIGGDEQNEEKQQAMKELVEKPPEELGEMLKSAVPEQKHVPRVFISHSKNAKILEQIKQMLSFGGFKHEIAEEIETTAIPIPEKIFGIMRNCNCAVINVSADEQEKHEDGSYGVNQNVLIEIGAAFLQYNKKIILLVDKRVELPSNLQGLYKTYYEGDELSWETGMKLQEALTKFRNNNKSELPEIEIDETMQPIVDQD